MTAPHVKWIFAWRLEGWRVAGIARDLTERGVPCPSRVDPERKRYRCGEAWTEGTVAAVLANPRYTGRQVWNRQLTRSSSPGYRRGKTVRRWNSRRDWVISKRIVHPPLVSEEDFISVEAIRAPRPTRDDKFRTYVLSGLMIYGVCLRRMDAYWVNGRAGYRCRHGHTSAKKKRPAGAPKNLYVRENHALTAITRQLAERYNLDPSEGLGVPTGGGQQPSDHHRVEPPRRHRGLASLGLPE